MAPKSSGRKGRHLRLLLGRHAGCLHLRGLLWVHLGGGALMALMGGAVELGMQQLLGEEEEEGKLEEE